MKTIADIKRAFTVGSKWHTINHIINKDFGIREISIVQSNQIALKTEHNGVITDSWLSFPKKTNTVFNSDTSFTIMSDDGRKVLTYTKAE